MTKPDAKQAISRVQPSTKAAQLREVMPEIERKLAAGVHLSAIHQALTEAGFVLSLQTLRTYLHRYRKKHGKVTSRTSPPASDNSGTPTSPNSVSYDTEPPATEDTQGATVSMQELDRLMKPDPAEQAADLAHYEKLAKQQRRSRKS